MCKALERKLYGEGDLIAFLKDCSIHNINTFKKALDEWYEEFDSLTDPKQILAASARINRLESRIEILEQIVQAIDAKLEKINHGDFPTVSFFGEELKS